MQRQYKIVAQTLTPHASNSVWLGSVDGIGHMPSPFNTLFEYRNIVINGVNNAIFF